MKKIICLIICMLVCSVAFAQENSADIKSLLTDLNNYQDQDEQTRAYYLLTQMGESALPFLMESLKEDGFSDMHHGNHSYTMKLIEKIGPLVVSALISSVTPDMIEKDRGPYSSIDPSYVTSVVKILGVIHDERAIPFYVEVLKYATSDMLKESVLWELLAMDEPQMQITPGRMDLSPYRENLVPLLLEMTGETRAGFYSGINALKFLGKLGAKESLQPILGLREKVSDDTKIVLAMALYDIGSDKYLDVLDEIFLIESIETVRRSAAELLYFKKGYKELIPKMIAPMGRESGVQLGEAYGQFIYGSNGLRHTLNRLPHICGEVLHVMTYQDFGPSQGKWKKWWQGNKHLSRQEWKQNRIKELKPLLEKAGIQKKLKLLEGLVGMEGEAVVDLVRPYLTVNEPHAMTRNVSNLAMETVKRSQSPRAKGIFIELLKGPDIWIAQGAVDFLKEYQDDTLVPQFLEYLKRYCGFVKEQSLGDCSFAQARVASILTKQGDPAGVGMLIDLVERNDHRQDAHIRELRAYTQQYFGYKRDMALEQKQEVLKKWRQWYEKEGKNAPIKVKEAFIDRDWRW